jgi:hypothetical protein
MVFIQMGLGRCQKYNIPMDEIYLKRKRCRITDLIDPNYFSPF